MEFNMVPLWEGDPGHTGVISRGPRSFILPHGNIWRVTYPGLCPETLPHTMHRVEHFYYYNTSLGKSLPLASIYWRHCLAEVHKGLLTAPKRDLWFTIILKKLLVETQDSHLVVQFWNRGYSFSPNVHSQCLPLSLLGESFGVALSPLGDSIGLYILFQVAPLY